ncbi:hypothetical protein ABEB36_002877 [Hypothenemus hampei]|uniref:Centrosomal protein of 78 kDa n=1 Tax=Hypothenemus hampei TaxID=57062 RepID=A0ABD1F7B2_HYPHA
MDRTKLSAITKTNPKPVSVFYVWYTELCRRLNINPSTAVKPAKPKCQTVLDFVADRLKVEEWTPLLSALRQDASLHVITVRSRIGNCQFLHEVDTKEKAKNIKRKYGSIWTAYILKQLLKSMSHSLRCTQVLTYLELDGLPLFMQYLEPLLQALKKNNTLKTLSFSNCSIQDSGCQLVCSYLRFTPNIEVLNLTGCNLSPASGEHLGKLIKYQQINRYCESWHHSLRYENPDAGKMRGIKRITINCNAYFGDTGLNFILDELEDDLWVKALDLQKCGLSENSANRIIDIVEYNKTLEIVDLRQNELLSLSTVEKVLQILKERQQYGTPAEFQWGASAVTLTWSSIYSATSKASFGSHITRNIHKTQSAPVKHAASKLSGVTWDPSLRKTKTVEVIQKQPLKLNNLTDTKKQVLALNDKLRKEIHKRIEIEKRNEELQSQLNQIKFKSSNQIKTFSGLPKRCSERADRTQTMVNNKVKKEPHIKKIEIKNYINKETSPKKTVVLRRKEVANSDMTMKKEIYTVGLKNNKKKPPNNVYEILEKLLNSGQALDTKIEDEMLNYFSVSPKQQRIQSKESEQMSVSNSQVSLYKYLEELKSEKI